MLGLPVAKAYKDLLALLDQQALQVAKEYKVLLDLLVVMGLLVV